MIGLPTEVTLNCGSCNACCRGRPGIYLHPEHGDDVSSYESTIAVNPVTNRPQALLKTAFNGDCIYLNRKTGCTIYDRRPHICRAFSCVGMVQKMGGLEVGRIAAQFKSIGREIFEAAEQRWPKED